MKKPWTPSEDAELLRMRREGMTYPQISAKLERSADSCESHFASMKKRPAPAAFPEPAPEAGGVPFPEPLVFNWAPCVINKPGSYLVLGDVHVPFHDMPTINAAVAEGKRRNVAGVILNGDIADCGELSDHLRDPDLPRYVEEVKASRQFGRAMRSEFPEADIWWKEGNHEERSERYLIRRAPALQGLEGIDMPSFLKLADVGIEWVSERRVIHLGKLSIIHGHEYSSPGRLGIQEPVNPARGLWLKAAASAMCGHFHRISSHPNKNIRQKIEMTWSVGCACYLTPEWRRHNQWQHGFALIELSSDGSFHVENKQVIDGRVA